MNDGTQTVKLPLTATNAAIFEHCYREDFVSDIPYEIQRADYYYDGLPIFQNAEVKILGTEGDYIEVQFVYGVNRETISPLFDKKLNEFTIDDLQIYYDDWVLNWQKSNVVYDASPTKNFNFPDYISGERVSDIVTIGDNAIQPKLIPEEPALSNLKEMTMHPFVEVEDVFSMIDMVLSTDLLGLDFDSRLDNKGIILSGNEGFENDVEVGMADSDLGSISDGLLPLEDFQSLYQQAQVIFPVSNAKIELDKNTIKEGSAYIYIKLTDAVNSAFTADINLRLFNGNDYTDIEIPVISDTPPTPPDTFRIYVRELVNYPIDLENVTHIALISSSTNSPHIVYINELTFSFTYNKPFYGYEPLNGYYDCIANLPKISCIEFVKQMLIHTGLFMGYSTAGALKTFSLDTFASNVASGTCYDWSGRISNVRKGQFQFNSNAQKNHIKFSNDKDLMPDRKETLTVNDTTIETEKDLYTFDFDSPLGAYNEKAEFILYEQTVKKSGTDGVSFENKYVGDKWNNGFVKNDSGVAKNLKVAEPTYYAVYKKLIERPTIREFDVNLGLYESATIDFEKPIYIQEFGRYCLLLELSAPNNELCVAKVLIVNQKLT
jgi:hypothetical protein